LDTLSLSDAKDVDVCIRDWHYQAFSAYGLRFGLRANDAATLDAACAATPFGWQPAQPGEIDVLYSLCAAQPSQEQHSENLLSCGSALIARAPDLEAALTAFNKHAELLTTFRAHDCLFVHAGVAGWQGQAIIIPGRSFSGKTTLVKALIEAGATYYSDEFAILDQQGLVHPYPLPLSLRDGAGQSAGQLPIVPLGGQVGTEPLPVGLVIVTQYQAGARWRPRPFSPSQALLALMDNTVAARREPGFSMPILREAVLGAMCIQSKRGDASRVASAILRQLTP
jgi:hypothetical protein